jgi:glycosyltransferase involved in cell wall biosynthesis
MSEPANGAGAKPLVSIIIRSMGRPLLDEAVASVLAQDYPNVELVVVDATGGRHPPLAPAWLEHGVRLVSLGRPLPRPLAANAGLDAARGAMLGFLDDDDTYDPDHVSRLMEHYSPMKPLQVIYAGARVLGRDGKVDRLMHHPYNPMMLMVNMYIQTGAAIFSRGFLALGCRFDESLTLAEDWDFWIQLSQYAPFVRTDAVTVNYRAELGTSGMGVGANVSGTSAEPMVRQVLEKWTARREALWAPVQALLAEARRALASGDRARAQRLSDEIYARYQIRFALDPVPDQSQL